MNLECNLAWEKEIVPGDDHVILCLEVLGAHIDEDYLADKTAHDYAGVLQKKIDVRHLIKRERENEKMENGVVWRRSFGGESFRRLY